MSTMACRIASAAVLAVLVGACSDAPTSPATGRQTPTSFPTSASAAVERWVTENLYDYTGIEVSYPCGENGYTEFIRMEGKLFERFTTTVNPAGGFTSLIQSMPVGLRGVGLTTGAEYRITEREHGVFTSGSMGQTTSAYQHFLTISSPELGVRGTLVIGGTFTVNANGELITERPILRAQCRE